MVSAGDFKNGLTVEIEGTVYQILEFQHVKPGKGAAFVRTKLKNIINGKPSVRQKSLRTLISTGKRCSISIMMEICIISWIQRRLTRLRSMRIQSEIL